jgi:hypothetical protein
MKNIRFPFVIVLAALSLSLSAGWNQAVGEPLKTRNVFLIITDGLRWQEVFAGAQKELLTKEHGGVANPEALQARFWRETAEARRTALLPFFWSQIAQHGQILGNRTKASEMAMANPHKFSYPGYNEILTGAADPRIDSNAKNPNPNVNVFEWLNGRKGLRNRVAVLATWDVFPFIFNVDRNGLPFWPNWGETARHNPIDVPEVLNTLVQDTTRAWDSVLYDSFLHAAVEHHIPRARPRVVFIGFGETDEWAHAGRYDRYLNAAHRFDDYVRRLWEQTQSISQYRGKTTFVLTTDHGRGIGLEDWKDHGAKTPRSEESWVAFLGPDTPALGERNGVAPIKADQIAATIAALLGEDYRAAFPGAGEAIADALP